MISDAAANVKKRSSSGTDRGQGRGSSGSDKGQGRGSTGSDRGRSSTGSDRGHTKVMRSPKESSFTESQEEEEFLNKVCKFELMSRGKMSPTATSPTNRSFGPDGSYKGGYSPGASSPDGKMNYQVSPEQHNFSHTKSSYQYAGEKLFTKETATTRVSADFLRNPAAKQNQEERTSTASTSSSSLTSVSSTGGATLSWHSDSPESLNVSKSVKSAGSGKSSPHSSGYHTSTPKSAELMKEFVTLKSPTTPYKTPTVKISSANAKLAMTLDAESLAESIMNGDLLTPFASESESESRSNRNTFEGMDFDFNELTASQQDLTMRHREIVAERKKEQEMEKLEKQRLEEILNMCAEYEEQITNPAASQKLNSSASGKKLPWSQFIENNIPNSHSKVQPTTNVFMSQGEQRTQKGNNSTESLNFSTNVTNSSYASTVSASYTPIFNGDVDHKRGNSIANNQGDHTNFHIYENPQEIKSEQFSQGGTTPNYKEVFYHRSGNDNLQALQDQWRPNVLYSQEGQTTVAKNAGHLPNMAVNSYVHNTSTQFDPNLGDFQEHSNQTQSSTPQKSPGEKKSPKFGVQVMFGEEFPKLSPISKTSPSFQEDSISHSQSKRDNSNCVSSLQSKKDNSDNIVSKSQSKKDNSNCYAEVNIAKGQLTPPDLSTPDKPTVNLSLKLQQDIGIEGPRLGTSHSQRPLQLPSFQDFSSDVNSLDRKERSELRSSGTTMSKIKTNGSLTMISSPSNSHKDIVTGFQMRRASSNSSNSEEESTSNSEDTGTIKRRPLQQMEVSRRRGSSSSNEGKEKIHRIGSPTNSPEELSSCPKFSPAMGSRSPKLTRRKVYKEEVSKLSAESDVQSESEKSEVQSHIGITSQNDLRSESVVQVQINGEKSEIFSTGNNSCVDISKDQSSLSNSVFTELETRGTVMHDGIYENIPARSPKTTGNVKVEVKPGLKLPTLVHSDITSAVPAVSENSGKLSRSSSGINTILTCQVSRFWGESSDFAPCLPFLPFYQYFYCN